MIFIFLFILICYYLVVFRRQIILESKRKRFCFWTFLLMLFIYIFKDNTIYPDLSSYETEFDYLRDCNGIQGFIAFYAYGEFVHEIGWASLTWMISRITDNFDVFLGIISTLICAGYCYGIYRLSKNPLFSFMFFILYGTAFNQSFFVLRQHLASAVILTAIPFLLDKKYKSAFALFVAAISFHYSAIIILPAIILYLYNKKPLSIIKIILYIILTVIFSYLLNNMTYERYQNAAQATSGNSLAFILTSSVLLMSVIFKKKISRDELNTDKKAFFLTYIIWGTLICMMSMGTSTGRLTNYFTVFLTCSLPFCIQSVSKFNKMIIYSMFLILALVLMVFSSGYEYSLMNLRLF